MKAPFMDVLGLPRPYIAYAIYPDGLREVITGWIKHRKETIEQAVERTAKEEGAVRVEIEILPI